MPITGGTPTVLANFGIYNNAAIRPLGPLIQIGSNLYGTTQEGGSSYNDGTVFSVPITGGTPTVVASFNGSNGTYPWGGPLTQIGSTLYGTTQFGGSDNGGTLFSVPIAGGAPTVLADFYQGAGVYPGTSLLQVGSTFYGTTRQGGITSGGDPSDWGGVFSVPVSGGGVSVLASFPDNTYATPSSLIRVGNTLYGTADNGGFLYDGSVFAITIPVTSAVLANGGYAGTQVTTIGPKPTTATILGGTASSPTTVTLDSAISQGLANFSIADGGPLLGDPVTLSGTGLDPFVLQMSYNPAYGVVNPYLGWLDEHYGDQYYNQWVNAVWGNYYNGTYDLQTAINDAHFAGAESYSAFMASIGGGYNVANYLGYYGYDSGSHTVWAIVNHNSGFAPLGSGPSGPSGPSSSVPEPGMMGLWLMGGLVCWRYGRKLRD